MKDVEKHITTAEIEAYINGKMSKKNIVFLKNHINQCSFCNDALEGIEMMVVPEISNQIKQNLRGKLNRRLKQESNKLLMPVKHIVGILIGFLLLIIIGYFIIHQTLKSPKNGIMQKDSSKLDFKNH